MDGALIAYRIPAGSPNTAYGNLVKKLYGQETSAQGGRYKYRRRGLLNGMPHRRLIRGVLIVRGEDARKVVSLLKELGAEVHVRTVKLTVEDRKELGL
jgi:hypothetical protein